MTDDEREPWQPEPEFPAFPPLPTISTEALRIVLEPLQAFQRETARQTLLSALTRAAGDVAAQVLASGGIVEPDGLEEVLRTVYKAAEKVTNEVMAPPSSVEGE